MNKQVGETEKNLASLLVAAQNGQAFLFLDEAYALFAKSMQEAYADDRYANGESNYLP